MVNTTLPSVLVILNLFGKPFMLKRSELGRINNTSRFAGAYKNLIMIGLLTTVERCKKIVTLFPEIKLLQHSTDRGSQPEIKMFIGKSNFRFAVEVIV